VLTCGWSFLIEWEFPSAYGNSHTPIILLYLERRHCLRYTHSANPWTADRLSIRIIFQTTVVSELTRAWAWFDFGCWSWRSRSFLEASTVPMLATICSEADDKLFTKFTSSSSHLLRFLLLPRRAVHYSLKTACCTTSPCQFEKHSRITITWV